MTKVYVSSEFNIYTSKEMDIFISKLDVDNLKWKDLLTLDYFFHFQDLDYDGGLSFFDRLNKKLGINHPNWDIDGLKRIVRNSMNPLLIYEDIVQDLLKDPFDIFYYGI